MERVKKYQVHVTRIGYAHHTYEVEARNKKEAMDKAFEEAGDEEFSEKYAEYEIEGVTEILDPPKKMKR